MSNRLHGTERVFKALANRRRLMIVAYLHTEKRASVTDIAAKIRLSVAATSRHLRQLATADIVESEQEVTTVYYSLPSRRHPALEAAIRSL